VRSHPHALTLPKRERDDISGGVGDAGVGMGVRAGVGDLGGDSLPENRTFFVLEPKELEAKLSQLALRQDRMSKDDYVTKEGAEFVGVRKNGDGKARSASLSLFPVSGLVADGGSEAAAAETHTRSDSHASALSTTVCLSVCFSLLRSFAFARARTPWLWLWLS
jgi:hypothetical protein